MDNRGGGHLKTVLGIAAYSNRATAHGCFTFAAATLVACNMQLFAAVTSFTARFGFGFSLSLVRRALASASAFSSRAFSSAASVDRLFSDHTRFVFGVFLSLLLLLALFNFALRLLSLLRFLTLLLESLGL